MEEYITDKELKVLFREERDRLQEIKRNLKQDKQNEEAIRLIDKRLSTIQENLED